jgi:hypothetical protein
MAGSFKPEVRLGEAIRQKGRTHVGLFAKRGACAPRGSWLECRVRLYSVSASGDHTIRPTVRAGFLFGFCGVHPPINAGLANDIRPVQCVQRPVLPETFRLALPTEYRAISPHQVYAVLSLFGLTGRAPL